MGCCCNPPPTCFFSTSCCCWWITYLLMRKTLYYPHFTHTYTHIHTWKPTCVHFKNTIQSNQIQSNPFEVLKIVIKRYHHRSHHIMDLRFVEDLVPLGLVSPCIYTKPTSSREGLVSMASLTQIDSSSTFNNINCQKNFHSQIGKCNWHSQQQLGWTMDDNHSIDTLNEGHSQQQLGWTMDDNHLVDTLNKWHSQQSRWQWMKLCKHFGWQLFQSNSIDTPNQQLGRQLIERNLPIGHGGGKRILLSIGH
jgi:hypothetical protein